MDELERMVRAYNVPENRLRTNVQRGAPTETLASGRLVLKNPVLHKLFRAGPIFREVKKHIPWATQVSINKNYASTPHRDTGNKGKRSAVVFFGPFTGGALVVRTPRCLVRLTKKRQWHEFDGVRDEHWVEPFKGDRWSVVATKQDSPKRK